MNFKIMSPMFILFVVKYAICESFCYNLNQFTICVHMANMYVPSLLNLLSDGKLHYKFKGNNK